MDYTPTTRAIVVLLLSLVPAAGCSGSTTPAADSGSGTDAASGGDGGGGVDAGAMHDATSATDAGAMIDSGGTTDAGDATDTGSATDAGNGSDGGCLALLGALNQSCTGASDCPSGFVCQPFSGVVLTQSCQIRCDDPSFSCPCGTACQDHSDKVSSWRQCDQL